MLPCIVPVLEESSRYQSLDELQRKLLVRIRQFDFGAKDVEIMVVSRPVDFLPSPTLRLSRPLLRAPARPAAMAGAISAHRPGA